MKILIIRISSLGDVILSTYFIRLLRNEFPDAQIDFLVSNEFSIVFKYNPHINNLIIYDKTKPFFHHIIETLSINNPRHYDVIIDLQNNPRSWIYSFGKGTRIFRFNKRRVHKFKLVYLKKRNVKSRPIPILYAETFPDLLKFDDNLGLEIWTSKDDKIYVPHTKQFTDLDLSKVGIAPGAKHFTKRLPPRKFVDLIRLLQKNFNSEIILFGGDEDFGICNEIIDRTEGVENLAGKTDVIETAEIIDSMGLVISNDSAVVHIASARKVPVVQIFGSTVPEFGFIPFRTPFAIVENNSIDCRPCTHFGKSRCPKQHFKCMEDITPEMILGAINRIGFIEFNMNR
ncbi:MAG: glycosyltransferase family 9 protein [Candidatus Kapaibacteriota bacterium]|jgi:heptosyltransferase-2